MNNYWETNYKATQEGFHTFRYSLRLHDGFDEAAAERFAIEVSQPLVALLVAPGSEPVEPPIHVAAERAVVTLLKTADDGNGLFLRLYNPGETIDTVRVVPGEGETCSVHRSDVREAVHEELPGESKLDPYQILTVRVVCSP
jgi:alpha-mannosidase